MKDAVKYSTGKGILFALIGMLVGVAIWLTIMVLAEDGTGIKDVTAGFLAALLGILVAGTYQKGAGKPRIVGIILVVFLTFIAAATTFTTGMYAVFWGWSVFDSFIMLRMIPILGLRGSLLSVFVQEFIIATGVSVAMAIVTLIIGSVVRNNRRN